LILKILDKKPHKHNRPFGGFRRKKMNKFLIRVFGKKQTEFSIMPKKGQTRKELVKEVDEIIGHHNYGAENYNGFHGCFAWEGK
jgi:hypothetical protein